MAFRNQQQARPTPYSRAPPQINPQYGSCDGCGGGKTLWQPTSGQRAGRNFIVCAKPFDQREGGCRTLNEIDLNTGHPIQPNPGFQAPVSDANYSPPPPPAPLHSDAPSFQTALHGWAEQTHEMVTHLAENVRLLTQVVEELKANK
jgi:hypothetical protein